MIRVFNFRPAAHSCKIGSFDIEILGITLEFYGFAVFQKDGKKWISFPSRKADEKYYPYGKVSDKQKKEKFDRLIFEGLDKIHEYQQALQNFGKPAPATNEEVMDVFGF